MVPKTRKSACLAGSCNTAGVLVARSLVPNVVGVWDPFNTTSLFEDGHNFVSDGLPAVVPRMLTEPDPLDQRQGTQTQADFMREMMARAVAVDIGVDENFQVTTETIIQEDNWIIDTDDGEIPISMSAAWHPFGDEKVTLKMDRM